MEGHSETSPGKPVLAAQDGINGADSTSKGEHISRWIASINSSSKGEGADGGTQQASRLDHTGHPGQEPIRVDDSSDSRESDDNDFSRALQGRLKRKRPSREHLTPTTSKGDSNGLPSKLNGAGMGLQNNDEPGKKRPRLQGLAYDQGLSSILGLSAAGAANTQRDSPSSASPYAQHGNDPNCRHINRNVRHLPRQTSKNQGDAMRRKAAMTPNQRTPRRSHSSIKHRANQRDKEALSPTRQPPGKAEREARLTVLASKHKGSVGLGVGSPGTDGKRVPSGNQSTISKATGSASDVELFRYLEAKQPPKPTTTVGEYQIPGPHGQPSSNNPVPPKPQSNNSYCPAIAIPGPGLSLPGTPDTALPTPSTPGFPTQPSQLPRPRPPLGHGGQLSSNNPVPPKPRSNNNYCPAITIPGPGIGLPGTPNTALPTPSTPGFPILQPSQLPPPPPSPPPPLPPGGPRGAHAPTPTQSRIPALPATDAFPDWQPVRTYTVFKLEQQVQTPSLDPDNQYITVREVRMRSHTSLEGANRHAEEAMARNDRRVQSAVRAKQWNPVERGPGEGNTFRGETVYASGERHVFETREEWVSLSDLPQALALRNGRRYPVQEPLLLDKEKISVYKKRFDVFSTRIFRTESQVGLIPDVRIEAPRPARRAVVEAAIPRESGKCDDGKEENREEESKEKETEHAEESRAIPVAKANRGSGEVRSGDSSDSSDDSSDDDSSDHISDGGSDDCSDAESSTPSRPPSPRSQYYSTFLRSISCKSESHGSYTCFKMANHAAMKTLLELIKPTNSRMEDNLKYTYHIRPGLIEWFDQFVRGQDAFADLEWAPPSGPYRWPFVMVKVWIEETSLKGPIDLGDMIVGHDEAVVEAEDADEDAGEEAAGNVDDKE